jgi:peptidoglycan/xylan/chitin deacetylase (PgdA/CDA1 family)
MFHSVGLENHPWVWSYISEPEKSFEAKIAKLKRSGFTSIFWKDVYEYMAGRRKLPDNSILLTFDDGYLDNWVYVYPILKKYGMKGTIFVSPDFIDPTNEVRPNIEDVKIGRCSSDDLAVPGFLSWPEMREMESAGLVDIQSHAMTHTWYFSGANIVDFHRNYKTPPYPWLFWNARPDRKPFYLVEDQQEFVPWGYPILSHQKSLEVRRFFPDDAAVSEIITYIRNQGGLDFFERNGWREELLGRVIRRFKHGQLPGHYETEEERRSRIRDELVRSKSLIETNLDKQVDFICWPGGANDETVREVAREVGYKSWTLSSSSQLEKRNAPGADPSSIKRIGTSNRRAIE